MRHVALLHAALAFSLACGAPDVELPRGPASIAGRVTAVQRAGEQIGAIRVELRPADSTGSPKAVVRVTQGTEILTLASARADFGTLRVGQWVRVWFTGPVRESYPVQADAATIVVDSLGPAR